MSTDQPTVLIVGSGAIGSFYGAILHRAGASVSVVSRSDYDVVSERGYRISSPLGDLSFKPAQVLRSVDECTTPPDFLVLSVKVFDDLDRAELIRPAVGPNTAIVLIQNGIEIEPPIAAAFPSNPLVSALAFIAVSRIGAGDVEHKAYGRLVLGDYPSGAGEACKRFGDLLRAGGVNATVTEQVVRERWLKAVWNAPLNPLAVLGNGADTQIMLETEGGEALARALMQEVCDVAAAAGHPLPPESVEQNISGTLKMPAYRNSMALDWLNDRPLELEAILGNVVREAQRVNVPVPHLQTVYTATKILLADREQRKRGG